MMRALRYLTDGMCVGLSEVKMDEEEVEGGAERIKCFEAIDGSRVE